MLVKDKVDINNEIFSKPLLKWVGGKTQLFKKLSENFQLKLIIIKKFL